MNRSPDLLPHLTARRLALPALLASLTLLAAAPGVAQQSNSKTGADAPPTLDCAVLAGGSVHTADGPKDGLQLLIDGGRIAQLGPAISDLGAPDIAAGTVRFGKRVCHWVDTTGQVVAPGFIDVSTKLGLIEVSLESASRHDDGGGDPVRASVVAVDGYNPRSSLIPVARLGGITGALIWPSGGLVSGQAGYVDLAGGSQAETVVERFAAMIANGRAAPSRTGGLAVLRELFDDVNTFRQLGTTYDRNGTRSLMGSRADLEALQRLTSPSVRAEKRPPLVVAVDRAADIEALLRLAGEEGFRLVIDGGAEAWLLADELAAAKVPVIVRPFVYGAGSFDDIEARPDSSALLEAAGVPIMISSRSSHFTRHLRQIAGNAVREGLSHEAAMRALTSTPAEVFGLPGRGVIEEGAVANVVVWSGDPLELSSAVQRLFIGGRDVALESRQTQLRDRYRELPGTPLPPLSLP